MTFKRKKIPSYIWILVVVAVVGISIAWYLHYKSNSKSNNSSVSKETSVVQSVTNPEVNNKNTSTGTIITTGDSKYGPMLFDSKGQAIYIWQLEDSSTPKCYSDCAQEWPPVFTDGAPVASGNVNSQLLGTTKRTDGTTQVTYNGHPLYYYAHEKPGEVECHNIKTHGGLWWVIQPNGTRAK